jgi:hypothetical protein
MRLSPYIKEKGRHEVDRANNQLRNSVSISALNSLGVLDVFGFMSAHLEHCEHAIRDRIVAGGIAGSEQHRKESDPLFQHRARVEQSEEPPTTTMPCTKLEPDIKGRMQDRPMPPMTTHPAKPASTQMYKATKPCHRDLEIHRISLPIGLKPLSGLMFVAWAHR